MYVSVCAHARGQYWVSSSIVFHLFFFETGFLIELEVHQFGNTDWPTSSRDFHAPPPQVLGLQACAIIPDFYMGTGSHSCS